jgi:methionyl-tRNA synthetase
MPPMKFSPSQTVRQKTTGKNKTEHFYMKSTKLEELYKALENSNTTPKRKQKIRNELVRRNSKVIL